MAFGVLETLIALGGPYFMTLEIDLPSLAIRVDPMSSAEVIAMAVGAARSRTRLVIGNHNLHSAYLVATNDRFRERCSAFDYRLIDGFPILVMASLKARRWLGSSRRVGSLDWVPGAVRAGGLRRVAVVGASVSSNAGAVSALRSLAVGTEIKGWAGEDWASERARSIVHELAGFEPELVLVGLGMPLQEEFLSQYIEELPTAVFATVGGAIDQLSGHQSPAPRWIGRFGVEWIWRFAKQPRRLAFRYFVEPLLLLRAVAQRGRLRSVDAG